MPTRLVKTAATWSVPAVQARARERIVARQSPDNLGALWLRRIARGSGALLAGFWVFIGILQAFVGSDPWTVESAILAALIVAAALVVATAWWRAEIGGLLLILVGALFLAGWWLFQRRDSVRV
jgi:uncharacterized membrane protein